MRRGTCRAVVTCLDNYICQSFSLPEIAKIFISVRLRLGEKGCGSCSTGAARHADCALSDDVTWHVVRSRVSRGRWSGACGAAGGRSPVVGSERNYGQARCTVQVAWHEVAEAVAHCHGMFDALRRYGYGRVAHYAHLVGGMEHAVVACTSKPVMPRSRLKPPDTWSNVRMAVLPSVRISL